MARFPGTVWAPLPEAGAPDGYEKTQFIVHSTGDNGTAAATARYFGGTTPNESTLIVGWGPQDPTLQIMDSTDRADANISASVRAISVEVVGDGKGGYNAWQRSELIRLGLEARRLHPKIAPRVIPAHDQPGFGWHVMFGAPGPWAGVAKVCPGAVRIAALKADIFPAIFKGRTAPGITPVPVPEEDVVDQQAVNWIADTLANRNIGKRPDGSPLYAWEAWRDAALRSDPAAFAAAVVAKLPVSGAVSGADLRAEVEAALRSVFADAAEH